MSEKKEKSMLSKFGSLFVTTEDSSSNEENENETTNTVVNESIQSNPVNVLQGAMGVVDPNLYNELLKVLNDHDLEGIDFLEFQKALVGMQNIGGMSEQQKFQAVFATLSAGSNITKSSIIETANHYVDVLKKETEEFHKEAGNKRDGDVGTREQQVSELNSANEEKVALIQKLTTEINDNQTTISHLQGEITEHSINIDRTIKNFDVTVQTVENEILNNVNKINTYIVETQQA